jgi:hypothetical protein
MKYKLDIDVLNVSWLLFQYDSTVKVQLVVLLQNVDTIVAYKENTEGTIINGQSRETSNIGYTRQDEDKQNKTTTQYVLDTTKTWALLQTTGSKDELNILAPRFTSVLFGLDRFAHLFSFLCCILFCLSPSCVSYTQCVDCCSN